MQPYRALFFRQHRKCQHFAFMWIHDGRQRERQDTLIALIGTALIVCITALLLLGRNHIHINPAGHADKIHCVLGISVCT